MNNLGSHRPSQSDRARLRRLSKLALALVVVILVVTMFAVQPPVFVWFVVVTAGVIVSIMVSRHAKRTTYRCAVCGRFFSISPLTDFASPHYPDKKLLTCPTCGRTEWCDEI